MKNLTIHSNGNYGVLLKLYTKKKLEQRNFLFGDDFGDQLTKMSQKNGDKFSESPNLVKNMSPYLVTNSVSQQI